MPNPGKTRLPVQGMSMVELVLILVLLGILSITVVGKLDSNSFAARGFATEVRTALRFAHKFALVSGCDVQVSILSASASYSLLLRNDASGTPQACLSASGAFGNPLPNPATANAYAGSGPAGSVASDLSLVFDASGAPSSPGSVSIAGSLITVEAGSGLIY